MSRAKESSVANLHGKLNDLYVKVAETLLEALDSESEEDRLMSVGLASPAMLTSMAVWVKQNGITCEPEDVQEVSELHKALEAKRDKRRPGSAKVLIMGIPKTGTEE